MKHWYAKELSEQTKVSVRTLHHYNMSQQLEHSWVKEIFTPEELKQYAEFENQMKTSGQKAIFEKSWQQLLGELKANLQNGL